MKLNKNHSRLKRDICDMVEIGLDTESMRRQLCMNRVFHPDAPLPALGAAGVFLLGTLPSAVLLDNPSWVTASMTLVPASLGFLYGGLTYMNNERVKRITQSAEDKRASLRSQWSSVINNYYR